MTEEPTRSTKTVLVVDDSHDNLVLVSLALQDRGYRVVTASNGEEAVASAQLSGLPGIRPTARARGTVHPSFQHAGPAFFFQPSAALPRLSKRRKVGFTE